MKSLGGHWRIGKDSMDMWHITERGAPVAYLSDGSIVVVGASVSVPVRVMLALCGKNGQVGK